VAGCMTAVAPAGLWAGHGVARVFSNLEKKDITAWVLDAAEASGTRTASGQPSGHDLLSRVLRPPVKVQEGCSVGCSYCIVPRTRGPERSLAPAEVLEKVRAMDEAGAGEIVITGVQLGSWGRDLTPRRSMADLLSMLLDADLGARLRLGSIEPWGVDRRLVGLFAARDARLCPHAHVPLQSGCDEVLGAMGRPYRAAEYGEILRSLVEADPEISIGTDVIAGFPGETDRAFDESEAFIRALPLSYIHAFSYSKRTGTRAAAMKGQVPSKKIRDRVRALRSLGEDKRTAFMKRFLEKPVEIVVEKRLAGGGLAGTSAHFFKVLVEPEPPLAAMPGRRLTVTVSGIQGERVLARP
jgi:threonylcarbamoyladenosine tRNA methylthiotransferase MtaB